MAKETEKLDDNFEEFDFDFDDNEFGDFFNDAPPVHGREALASTLKNAGASFVSEFNVANVENIGKLLEKTIPLKMQTNVSNLVDMKDSLLKELQEVGPSIKSSTNRLINLTEKYLPKGGMVENAVNKLKEYTSPDSGSGYSEPSKEEVLNNKLVNMLEETINEKSKKEYYEQKLQESLDYTKNLNTLQIQNNMAANLERLANFNIDITSSFYRKTLELQFRQLDTSLEMLTVNKVANDTFKNQLEAIVKNTSLPDAVKLRSTEVIAMLAKNKIAESAMDSMFGEGTRFDKMKKRAMAKFSGVVQGVEEALSEAAGMGEMMEMMREQAEMMGGSGGMFGTLAADFIQSKIGEKISDKLAKSKTGNKMFATMQNMFTDPSEFFKDKLEESYKSNKKDSIKEKLKRAFFSNMQDITRNDFNEQVTSMSKPNMNESAILDNRLHTSVTKTIPAYLSELLHETASIYKLLSKNTGITERADKKLYDIDTDKMITESETKFKIKNKLAESVKKSGGNWNIKKAADKLLENSKFKFAPEDRASIEKGMIEYMMNGGTANANMFTNKDFLSRLKDPKLIKRVMRLSNEFNNKEDQFQVATDKGEINSYLNRAMNSIKNPRGIIDDFKDKGNLDLLRQMGLVNVDETTGRVNIDNKKYKELVADTFYQESLKDHMGLKEQQQKYSKVNKETQDLFNSVADIKLKETDLAKNINNKLKKARRYAKTKKPVKDVLKAKDAVMTELTGENLDKHLEALSQELTKENLTKRAKQAYELAVKETSEDNIKKRKQQLKDLSTTLKDKSDAMMKTAKEELTKDNLIKREKELRTWIDEKVTKENASNLKDNLIQEFSNSKIKQMIDEKVKESTIAKIIDDNIKKAIETGGDIKKSELVSNILREAKVSKKAIANSELFKSATKTVTDKKSDILNVKIKDKTISEYIDTAKEEKDKILEKADKRISEELKTPLSDKKTFVETISDLTDKLKLVNIDGEEELIVTAEDIANMSPEELALYLDYIKANDINKNLDKQVSPRKVASAIRKKIAKKFKNKKEAKKTDEEKQQDILDKATDVLNKISEEKEIIKENIAEENKELKSSKNPLFSKIKNMGGSFREKIMPSRKEHTVPLPPEKELDNALDKEKKSSLLEKISELIETLSENKEAIKDNSKALEEDSKSSNKFAFNDTDKSGNRDGSWKDKFKSFTRGWTDRAAAKVDANAKNDKEKDKGSGVWDIIKMFIPFSGLIGTLLSSVGGLLGTVTTFSKGVFGLVSALSNVTRFLGTGIIGPILKLLGGAIPGLLKLGLDVTTGALGAGWKGLKGFMSNSSVTRGAEKKMFGSMAKAVGKKALSKVPGLGVAAGAYLGYDYLKGGDMVGALGTWASTLMAQIPVVGTGASLLTDAWLAKRDMDKEEEDTNKQDDEAEQEAADKETARKEEESKLKDEWEANQESIKKQLDAYDNQFSDIEKKKEKIQNEEADKVEEKANNPVEKEKNSFDDTPGVNPENPEGDPEKQKILDEIKQKRENIKAKLLEKNGGVALTSTAHKQYNAYANYGVGNSSGGDRFAANEEPITYRNTVGASKDEIKQIITDNSKKAGMNPGIMLTMAAKESSMDPNAKAPTSSATGLYQFLKDTWNTVVEKYGSKYGITPANANRNDPAQSTLMAAEYLKQNLAPIKQVKGNINATDAYLTHFLGPGGARKFLSASPADPSSIMGSQVVSANSSIFMDGARIRSIGEVYRVIAKQLKKTADEFGISGVVENRFNSAGTSIANPTDSFNVTPDANASAEPGVSVPDSAVPNPIEQTTPATNKVAKVNASNNVQPSMQSNNAYTSKAMSNAPMDVSNIKTYTSQMDTSMNNKAISDSISRSVELSSKNSNQLDSIITNTGAIATNTAGTNTILGEVKTILGQLNETMSNLSIPNGNNSKAMVNNNPPEKQIDDVVSMGRGLSLL